MATTRGFARPYWVALRYMIVATVVLGIAYPVAVLGIGQLALPAQANGSIVTVDGEPVGSSLLGQSFADADGTALAEWFQSRPSAAGYDGGASVASNYGPENPDFLAEIEARRAAIAEADGVPADSIPVDALTTSGSGLDPHISPEYAYEQVARVATARGLSEEQVKGLVDSFVQGRDLGYLGEPTVNVLQLNVALSQLAG
ncbi:potassium-transporting ATPase subunit KdpC [Herbiconiux sp. KACC 21604]|uniref:potassium-transporting ATPase subunit KdpC n=1 Tax=unclassified Herbiconiux TaxID=2618217 RepID=UPI0014911D7E|nr:potassium-transporting ATPase subunit KdpC [Herbiconiux sp. SALV-R1]QJU55721.1 potassium-transporting ATPase subunit KdpC [Herbiconiux sp. SALV-R1]WPO86927.1 potassium-transporting ATPase subunit KdpC [Herbiconiux sp. KACC 21604]